MSTRYIWSYWSTTTQFSSTTTEVSTPYSVSSYSSGSINLVGLAGAMTLDSYTGMWEYSGVMTSDYQNNSMGSIDTNDYPYCIICESDYIGDYIIVPSSTGGTGSVDISSNAILYFRRRYTNTDWHLGSKQLTCKNSGDNYNIYKYNVSSRLVADEILGYASSASSNEYDTGYDGRYYWYTQSAQEVDPTLTLPATAEGGDTISLTITRSQDAINNRYGTLYYTVEYSLAGGAWTTLADETSNQFSFNISIPEGTETVQARVLVSDNLGYTSNDYVYSNTTSVNNNEPPTAPGRVTASNVVANNTATISITAATDPDGEVTNYEWSRSIDGGAYSVFQTTDADTLSITDEIGTDWGTVTYRVRAKDDYGEWGPYATSDTYTINEGLLTIAAPGYSLGLLTSPFYYTFSIGITGQPISTDQISAVVYLDNRQIYEASNLEKDESVSVPVDPRLLSATTHSILIRANKEGYTTAEQTSDFYIEGISAPAGGIIEQLQNSAGQAVLPYTLGQCVIGRDGKDFNTLLEETEAASLKIESGSYSGSGVYGQYNPNTISTSFLPKMFTVTDATGSSSLVWTGSPSVNNVVINASSSGISWYGTSATNQFNLSGQTYYYTVIG